MKFAGDVIPLAELAAWREEVRKQGRKVVATHGCFDVLHAGHVTYLRQAREQGDLLLVGLNGDESVRTLKGPTRPVNCEEDRASILAGLRFVDAVCVYPETRAVNFLKLAQPDIYVKGGDYTLETLNPEERGIVQAVNAKIVFIPFLEGRSTTAILQRSKS